ncbi:MAG: hypothetical protein V2A65_02940 [Candidatus Omnitrophota bacterium]
MVFVVKNGEDEWKGYLIDGYLPSLKNLRSIYREAYDLKPIQLTPNMKKLTRDNLFTSSMFNIMMEYCKKVSRENPELLIEEHGRLQHKNYCDSYLLKFHKNRPIEVNKKPEIIKDACLHLQKESDLDNNKKDYRQILLFSHYCPNSENCINNAIKKTGFRIKQPEQYTDIRKFENACGWLLKEEGFSVFIYPCNVLEERLKGLNFECTRP